MTPQSPAPVAGDEDTRPASEQPVEAIGAGRVLVPLDTGPNFFDSSLPYEMIMAGADAIDQATDDMANYVSGDTTDWDSGMMAVAVYRAMVAAALSPASPARLRPIPSHPDGKLGVPASPARSPMGEPVAWIERQNDGTRYGEPKRWPPSDRARSYAQEMGRTIEPLYAPASPARPELTVWYGKMPESNGRENWTAVLRRVNPTDKWDQGFCFARSEYPGRVLYEADRVRWIIGERAERPDILAYDADAHSGYVEPASPARTPMGGPQVLKGVGKINGDGWKDTTTIGEVVYVWNAEKPSPYAPGQYPRIWNEGWSASTAQYDFSPASIDEVRALAAPTPMGGEVEALREADWNRDLTAAPEGEAVLLATTAGHVGEAIAPVRDDPDDDWFWAGAGFVHANHKPVAWKRLPTHPDALPPSSRWREVDGFLG